MYLIYSTNINKKTKTEANLSKEQHLNQLKRAIFDNMTTIKILGEKYELSNRRYQQKADEFAPQHIKELLQIAVSTAETNCDSHVEDFQSGKIDVQLFLDRYVKAKVLSTLRKAKEERLTHQLNALERAATTF